MENAFKPKTRKELANAYGISRKTLYRWLKEFTVEDRNMITSNSLKILYAKYGNPYAKTNNPNNVTF